MPLRVATKLTPLPSCVHRVGIWVSALGGTSKTLSGAPPLIGITAICQLAPGSERYQQAIFCPSGETSGQVESLSVNCTGSPPSIETFHKVCLSDPVAAYMTHLPSAETAGNSSLRPLVSCFCSPESRS